MPVTELEPWITDAVRGYVECALWSSTDDEGSPLDGSKYADDPTPELRAKLAAHVHAFALAHPILCREALNLDGYSAARLGHDLWLTRNGHGAGFGDRGRLSGVPVPSVWGRAVYAADDLADALTQAAQMMGECHLAVGDDGRVCIL